ncbi:Ig-like domain repeat protein [Aeromicrobium sp. CFBP 8757]|uniref:Ig-like domain repeat protein n=1 Tax=Aeromicrobium sp. CFBP 8757 TaxID=2775288 RepID=UPI00177D0DE9|nr:Ig-like domain repeat protein [Aeromicrobium sp. CFBP 8757]MBD8606466.1 Ig-like domain repeat protein [Aeromicrobium sp. CFBP 8757]
MIRQRVSLAVAGAVVATTALTAGMATSASAAPTIYDPSFTPTTGDLSGAGSDTTEIALDYLTKGHNGIEGFNADRTSGRIASFAAGTDPATVVLKAGASPITRPNGSGAGKTLLRPATNNADVDFARSSSGLSPAEITDGLQQSAFAVDGLKLAVSSSATNAPASISDADLVKIYQGTITTWGQTTGYAGSAPSATIKPLIPQSGSGTRSFFEAQLKSRNGGVSVTLGANVTPTQEHSDVDIKDNPNAIAPFSTGRAKTASTIKTIGGFSAQRALYNVVRTADLSGAKGTLIQSVFGPNGFVCSPAAKPLIEAAGFDQLASVGSAGGACGTFGQTDVTNFTTSNSVAQSTTTTLSAAAQNGKSVKLTAAVSAASGLPNGKVVFSENGAKIGTGQVIGGSATLTLTNVALGAHTYTATYNPTNAATFTASQSGSAATTVLKTSAVSVGSAGAIFGRGASVPISVTSDGAPAGGSVTVNAGGVVSTVGLSGGSASVTMPAAAAAGLYAVTVTYNGDGSTSPSSAAGSLSISKASSAASLKLSKKSIKASKKVKATVTVKIAGSALKAGGKVTLKAGSKTVGKGTVKNGKATITLKKLKKGSYKIKATFAGDANVNGSSTKAVKLKVTK